MGYLPFQINYSETKIVWYTNWASDIKGHLRMAKYKGRGEPPHPARGRHMDLSDEEEEEEDVSRAESFHSRR